MSALAEFQAYYLPGTLRKPVLKKNNKKIHLKTLTEWVFR